MSIGNKIKEFGELNFSSVVEFARACEVPRESLYKYFKGEVSPGGEFLEKLHKLGCDMNWLFGDESNIVRESRIEYKIKDIEKENKLLKEALEKIQTILTTIQKGNEDGK